LSFVFHGLAAIASGSSSVATNLSAAEKNKYQKQGLLIAELIIHQ